MAKHKWPKMAKYDPKWPFVGQQMVKKISEIQTANTLSKNGQTRPKCSKNSQNVQKWPFWGPK